jgi:hypothetical protein
VRDVGLPFIRSRAKGKWSSSPFCWQCQHWQSKSALIQLAAALGARSIKKRRKSPDWAGAPRWGWRQRCWLLASCRPLPPPTAALSATCLGLVVACGAGRRPSSPVLLSGSSVGQRGVSAQTIRLLVPVALNYIGALRRLSPLPPVHCQLLPPKHHALGSRGRGRGRGRGGGEGPWRV